PTALISTVSGTDISCFGMNDGSVSSITNGGTSPYTHMWSNGSSAVSQSNLMMGTYSVVITDANGCMSNGSAMVNEPAEILIDLGGDDNLCDGESVVLDAGAGMAGYSYAWTTGGSSQLDTVSASGLGVGSTIVGVVVTDANSCTGADSVEIMVSAPVSTTVMGNDELCMYEIGDLDAGPGFASYEWSNSSTSQLIKVYPADLTIGTNTLMVTVTNSLGCEGVASYDVELHPEVVFNLQSDTTIWKDSAITITADSGYASYLWNTQETTQSINVTMGGTYSCVVTDMITGCEGSDDVMVEFVLGVNSVDFAEMKLYPNPTTDFINLEFSNFANKGVVEIEILSITGQLVRKVRVDVSSNNGTQTIDVSNLAVGTYVVKFEYENEQVVKQFVIK
ncbi:MAG: T9SS type A sorting domain-containing protein, partial [Salibacteraceae bacterium]